MMSHKALLRGVNGEASPRAQRIGLYCKCPKAPPALAYGVSQVRFASGQSYLLCIVCGSQMGIECAQLLPAMESPTLRGGKEALCTSRKP